MRILAVGQDARACELGCQQRLRPGLGLSLCRPVGVSIAGQAIDEADVDGRVIAVVEHPNSVRKGNGGYSTWQTARFRPWLAAGVAAGVKSFAFHLRMMAVQVKREHRGHLNRL